MVDSIARVREDSVRLGTSAGASTAARFGRAIEARDHDTIRALMAEDVRFFGPYRAKPDPVKGVKGVGAVLWTWTCRFKETHYVGQFGGLVQEHSSEAMVETHLLLFRAEMADGKRIEGIDLIEVNDDGLISKLTVLLRPVADSLAGTFYVMQERWPGRLTPQ
jgi:hypothetical protein